MLKTLHILPDEKFYTAFIHNQEKYAPNNKNDYFLIHDGGTIQNPPQKSQVKILTIDNMRKILINSSSQDYHQVIFHSLPGRFRKLLLRIIPPGIKITWIFYGYEYYHRRNTIEEYLGPFTRAYYNSWNNPNILRIKALRLLDQLRNENNGYKKDLQRIHRFAHWNHSEYEVIRVQYQLDSMEYEPFSMGSKIHEVVPDHDHRYLLLGHSGALTVNHLDGINALSKKFMDGFDRILIPFSYGGDKSYEIKVRKAAEAKMGDNVILLNRLMDRISYFNLLSRVNAAWMPQLRGMGGGNILFCLKNNIPLFFWKDSVMYQYYTDKGFHVFAIDDIDSTPPELTPDQKQNNQSNLTKYFGEQTINDQYQRLLHQ